MPSVYLEGKNNQTKQLSVACGVIDVKSLTAKNNGVKVDGELDVGEVVSLFRLPANCLITRTDVVANTGTTGGGHIKVSADDTDIFADAAIGSASTALVPSTTQAYCKTGCEITATVGTAKLTDGVITICVYYTELDRTTGNYLN